MGSDLAHLGVVVSAAGFVGLCHRGHDLGRSAVSVDVVAFLRWLDTVILNESTQN